MNHAITPLGSLAPRAKVDSHGGGLEQQRRLHAAAACCRCMHFALINTPKKSQAVYYVALNRAARGLCVGHGRAAGANQSSRSKPNHIIPTDTVRVFSIPTSR